MPSKANTVFPRSNSQSGASLRATSPSVSSPATLTRANALSSVEEPTCRGIIATLFPITVWHRHASADTLIIQWLAAAATSVCSADAPQAKKARHAMPALTLIHQTGSSLGLVGHAARRKRRRRRSSLARPYIERFSSLRRLTCLSCCPRPQDRRRSALGATPT